MFVFGKALFNYYNVTTTLEHLPTKKINIKPNIVSDHVSYLVLKYLTLYLDSLPNRFIDFVVKLYKLCEKELKKVQFYIKTKFSKLSSQFYVIKLTYTLDEFIYFLNKTGLEKSFNFNVINKLTHIKQFNLNEYISYLSELISYDILFFLVRDLYKYEVSFNIKRYIYYRYNESFIKMKKYFIKNTEIESTFDLLIKEAF